MFFVYRIENLQNGKSYIGISCRPVGQRFQEHLSRARCGTRNSRLYAAIRKYGPDAFRNEVLATTDSESEVREMETIFIKQFDTYENGYNCNLGGVGFLKFPRHIVEKISNAQKGKIISKECREKMSLAKIGKSACATHFGKFTNKGASNPKSGSYLIRFPDGSERTISGMRQFCRDNSLSCAHLYARGKSKGFMLLGRLND